MQIYKRGKIMNQDKQKEKQDGTIFKTRIEETIDMSKAKRKTISKDSFLYWYPKIRHLNIPQPKSSEIVITDNEFKQTFEGIPKTLIQKVRDIIYSHFELPVFIRTDQASGKHSWKDSCFHDGSKPLWKNLYGVIEFNHLADFMGLDFQAIVIREYIPMDSKFTAFWGQMPVNPERRYFIDNGKVLCHHCCSEDTEIMTEHGFKYFKDLNKTERVFSLNPATQKIELLKPDKYIAHYHAGKMIHIKNHNFDMLVTPEHRIPIIDNRKNAATIKFIEAKNMRYNFKIPRTGKWSGNEKTQIAIAGEIYPTNDFFEFIGYFLSEGCYVPPSKSNNSSSIIISQNSEKIMPIINCIEKLNISFTLHEQGRNRCQVSIHRKKYSKLAQYLNIGKSHEKYIPAELKEYGPKYLRILLDAFRYGDGATQSRPKYNSVSRVYYTSSKQLANDISELILKVGNRPSQYRYHKKAEFTIRGKTYITKHPVITINECNSRPFVAKHPSGMSSKNQPFEDVNYDGMVYCVTLPRNHIFYIRRNGKCTWTGNSYWIQEAITNPSIENWQEVLEEINIETPEEIKLLSDYAELVAKELSGFWSIDFCKAKDGRWILIDMATGERSWHPKDCPHNKN
jgi:hypothetical protein